MSPLPQPSIRRKLTFTIAITSGLALALAAAALVVYDIATYRQAVTRDVEALADLVGGNSTASLSFGDATAAGETLRSLAVRPDVEAAALYTASGQRLAAYTRTGQPAPPTLEGADGVVAGGREFAVVRPVTLDGQPVGRVFIRSSLNQLEGRVWRTVSITTVVFILSMALAIGLGQRLQGPIAFPIQMLSRAAKRVSSTRDYSLRIEDDPRVEELGVLVGTFNDMLAQIQARDLELQRHQEHLEVQVAQRTAQLTEAKGSGGRGQPRQERVPGQHEPRDPDADERRPRHGRARARRAAAAGAAGPAADDPRRRPSRCCVIIDDILDFSKIEAGRLDIEPMPFVAARLLARTTVAVVRAARAPEGADAAVRRAGRCAGRGASSTPGGCARCW